MFTGPSSKKSKSLSPLPLLLRTPTLRRFFLSLFFFSFQTVANNLQQINEYLDIIDDLYSRQPELTVLLLKVCRNSNVKTEAAALNLAYERNEPQAVEIFRNMVGNCLSGVQKTLDTYNIKHDVFDFESELGWEV